MWLAVHTRSSRYHTYIYLLYIFLLYPYICLYITTSMNVYHHMSIDYWHIHMYIMGGDIYD